MTRSNLDPRRLLEEALAKYGHHLKIDERDAKVIAYLAEQPRTFKEISVECDIPKGTLGRRMMRLAHRDIVKSYDTHRKTFYEPRVLYALNNEKFAEILKDLLEIMRKEFENLKLYISLCNTLLKRLESEVGNPMQR